MGDVKDMITDEMLEEVKGGSFKVNGYANADKLIKEYKSNNLSKKDLMAYVESKWDKIWRSFSTDGSWEDEHHLEKVIDSRWDSIMIK